MVRARLGRLAANVLMVAMLFLAAPTGAAAQGAADVDAPNEQVVQLYGQGKYKEAASLAEKALALAGRVLGREHPDTLTSVNNLAGLYQAQGRYGEAEALLKARAGGQGAGAGAGASRYANKREQSGFLYRARAAIARQSRFISERWRAASGCWAPSIPIRF